MLTGTFTDTGTYSAWSDGPWVYSGFKRTLTFTNLVFRYPDGAQQGTAIGYQLCGSQAASDCPLRGPGPTVSFTPYTETATDGTCTWTWQERPDPSAVASGQLQLSLASSGRWTATSFQLQVEPLITNVQVSGQNNCQFDKPFALPPAPSGGSPTADRSDYSDGPFIGSASPNVAADPTGQSVTFTGTTTGLEAWQGPQTHEFSGQIGGQGCPAAGASAGAADIGPAWRGLAVTETGLDSLVRRAATNLPCADSITASRLKVPLGGRETLAARLSPPGTTATTYSFEIRRAGRFAWDVLGSSSKPTWSLTARSAGHFQVRVIALSTAKKLISPPVALEVEFPIWSEIAAEKTVKRFTDASWAETLRLTTPTTRRELGYWIWLDTCGRVRYGHTPTELGRPTGVDDAASLGLSRRPRDQPENPPGTGCGKYFVANFHTHTPTTHLHKPGFGRDVGPSTNDERFANRDEVPGFVYDYRASRPGSGSIPLGYPLGKPARMYVFGYLRRPTPR